jgi:hypothetical protein
MPYDYEADRAFRAQHLCDAANRLEHQADELRERAKEYRDQAAKMNPTGAALSRS